MSLPVEITGKESPAGDGSALDALMSEMGYNTGLLVQSSHVSSTGWGHCSASTVPFAKPIDYA